MIRVSLSFVPQGGGEVDYGLTMDMPALPRAGDYISVIREREGGSPVDKDQIGSEDFIVRRVWWSCTYPDDGKFSHKVGAQPVGECKVNVECEFAVSPFSSPMHKRAVESYESRGKGAGQHFEETNY